MRTHFHHFYSLIMVLAISSCRVSVQTSKTPDVVTPAGITYDPWHTAEMTGPITGTTNLPPSALLHDPNPTKDPSARRLLAYEEYALTYPENRPGHRLIPDVLKDDDAVSPSSPLGLQKAVRPSVSCGLSQTTVAARIADCLQKNPTTAFWEGEYRGGSTEANWSLVTKTQDGQGIGSEVWKDLRTGMLWSDSLGTTNWCKATGNAQANDPNSICNNATHQDQTSPESWCTEGLDSSLRVLNVPVSKDEAKGFMRMNPSSTSPSVLWRLPSSYDFTQGFIDGINFVIPLSGSMWSGLLNAPSRNHYAEIFYGNGATYADVRNNTGHKVYCIGFESP